MPRRLAALALLLPLVAGLASFGAEPAAADDVPEPFIVGANQTVTRTLGPILVNDPATTQVNDRVVPEDCITFPSCNLIHLKFPRPPGYSEKDTFLATIEVAFNRLQVDSGDSTVGSVALSDIDAYLYREPIPADADNGGEIDRNASVDNPFRFLIDVTQTDAYQVALNNATGVQQTYTVKATTLYIPFEAPFESLDPNIAPPVVSDGAIPTVASSSNSSSSGGQSSLGIAAPITGGSAASTFAGAAPAVGAVPDVVAPDDPLAAGVDSLDPSLEAVLGNNLNDLFDSGGNGKRSLIKRAAVSGPPKPVKGPVLILWLLGLPLVLGSIAAGIIRKRRPAAMSMDVPTGALRLPDRGLPEQAATPAVVVDADGNIVDGRAARFRRRALFGWAVAVLVVAVAAMAIVLVRAPKRDRPVVGSGAGPAFAANDPRGLVGATGAAYSPNGTRLAVETGGGRLGIAEAGLVRPITPVDATIAAFVWRDEQSLYVMEGPSSTGTLVLLDLQGATLAQVRLDRPFPPGDGLALSPDRRTAVAVSSVRSPFGGRPSGDLQQIDIDSGRVTPLVTTGDDEDRPTFVDDDHVAYGVRSPGGATSVAIAALDGSSPATPLATANVRLVGVLQTGELAVQADRELQARKVGATPRRILGVGAGVDVVAVERTGERAVVREPFDDQGTPTNRLREVRP